MRSRRTLCACRLARPWRWSTWRAIRLARLDFSDLREHQLGIVLPLPLVAFDVEFTEDSIALLAIHRAERVEWDQLAFLRFRLNQDGRDRGLFQLLNVDSLDGPFDDKGIHIFMTLNGN